ncbi:MAG: O-acetyl-ADP-ribose deacetylase [Candidatus Omnitrophica bacterium]|nr:O-acetyl-ADP-ribose deacetylase [Candidatus Omnitrophota bacterium]
MPQAEAITHIELVQADITTIVVDAIVNAANSTLCGGGGVDGAIHRAAGPELLAECRTLGRCATGQAKITKGYRLPARYVIHAVGPVWQGRGEADDELLVSCYREALLIAQAHKLGSIAFPSISTGAYRFPIARAAVLAVGAVRAFVEKNPSVFKRIIFTVFSKNDFAVYDEALRKKL